jgi:hypothetical protein
MVKRVLVQGREFTPWILMRSHVANEYADVGTPKRKSLPPLTGEATTAWADLGPGHVLETNFRHSSCNYSHSTDSPALHFFTHLLGGVPKHVTVEILGSNVNVVTRIRREEDVRLSHLG